jgi:gas vesicle protein
MTRSHEVGCFFFGCTVGVAAALALAPESRRSALKYLRKKATRGVDYARTRLQEATRVVDDAAARTEKIVDRVGEGLDSAKKMIASVERLRQHS